MIVCLLFGVDMKYIINGGNKLSGEVKIQSAKNSVVALMSACILARGDSFICNCPKIFDVTCMAKILKRMGARVRFTDGGLSINTDGMYSFCLPEKLTRDVRASFFMVGSLLARFGEACICRPGGCQIGSRPVDIHIDALMRLGAKFVEENGVMHFTAEKLTGAKIRLKYPSVGATENVMMCAATADGVTVLENAAREPEIVDLQNVLNLMGAKISGAGTPFIRIDGVKKLSGVDFMPIPDRIETGTYLLAAVCAGGEIGLRGARPQNISSLIEKLLNNTCKLYLNSDIIYIRVDEKIRGLGEIVTSPYPGFPTDLQPLAVSAACLAAEGEKTAVKETVFESRFRYAEELAKMGARLAFSGDRLEVLGGSLHGGAVTAPDLRGGASLCIAALGAEGQTEISEIRNIERGYESFDLKLAALGANVVRK